MEKEAEILLPRVKRCMRIYENFPEQETHAPTKFTKGYQIVLTKLW